MAKRERTEIVRFDAKTGKFQNKLGGITEKIRKVKDAAKETAEGTEKAFDDSSGKIAGALDVFTGGLFGELQTVKEGVRGLVPAFKGLRGAIISTGVGALIVLLGELIANFDTIQEWFRDKTREEALMKENKLIEKRNRLLSEELITLESQEASARVLFNIRQEMLENDIKRLRNLREIGVEQDDQEKIEEAITGLKEKQLELSKLMAEEEARRTNLREEARRLIDEEYAKEAEERDATKQFDQELEVINKRRRDLNLEMIELSQRIKEIREEQSENELIDVGLQHERIKAQRRIKEIQEEQQKIVSDQQLFEQARLKALQEYREGLKETKDVAKETADQVKEIYEPGIDVGTVQADLEAAQLMGAQRIADERVRINQEAAQQIDATNRELIAKREQDTQASNDRMTEMERQAAQARVQLAQSAFGAMADLVESFTGANEQQSERAFKISKALRVAQTVIGTYQAAQQAYLSQLSLATPDAPIRAAVAAGAAVAQGLAQLNSIRKTKFESNGGGQSVSSGGGGGGVGGIGAGGGIGGDTGQNIDFGFLQQNNEQAPIRAYVLSQNVQESAEANQLINDQSTL